MLVGAPGINLVSSQSQDTRRVRTRRTVVAGAVADENTPAAAALHFEEDLATQAARAAEDFSWDLGADAVDSAPDVQVDSGIEMVVRRSKNSDRPLHTWRPFTDEYCSESLHREGRGASKIYRRCAGVTCVDPDRQCPNRVCTGLAEYRCSDSVCFGEVMHCVTCIVAAHASHPTHFIEKWNGNCFVRSRNLLRSLGLRVQLGHPPGVVCAQRKPAAGDFVLYDFTGVHELAVDFCGCVRPRVERRTQLLRACWWPATVLEPNTCATFAVLKQFQILNCLGKLTPYAFVQALERTTNHDGLDRVPDQRKPFMHILRQWREVKRLKCFKRGHLLGGHRETRQGSLALPCRACPHPGWNLPANWKDAPPEFQFIYFLYLAQDSNYRLANRNVSTEEADPIWGDGQGYFARREGADGYKAHIEKYTTEEEISSCSGFQAMFLANMKQVKGLRTTGMGERYCNVDYLLLSLLLGFALLWLVVSYDIACQYYKKFWERVEELPDSMKLHIPRDCVFWKVPNFHLMGHGTPCHCCFSFHFLWGAGKSHGETVEQNWSFSNGAAASTKRMGPGGRHGTLEDIFGFHNFERQLAMHRVLPRRLAEAIDEAKKCKLAHEAFTEGLMSQASNEVAEWRAWVEEWEKVNEHIPGEPCPFEYTETLSTLKDIQLAIATEELIWTEDRVAVEQETTPGTFITEGLAIEKQQRQLETDVKALQHPSATQSLGFVKRRTALLKRIHKFRKMQLVFMPALRCFLTEHQKQMLDGNGEQPAEATRLFMPSEILDDGQRGRACVPGLCEVEAQMRVGEAKEALEVVRNALRTRTKISRFRIRNYTGQGALTRGQGILRQVTIKLHIGKIHYRYARAALGVLRGHGEWEQELQVLREEDVRGLNERSISVEEESQLEQLDELTRSLATPAGISVAAGLAAGEGAHTLSWIWYKAGKPLDENDPKLHEGSTEEEVRLLREEMRRTIAYGETEAGDWESLAEAEVLEDEVAEGETEDGAEAAAAAELSEGCRAYATERALTERVTCAFLRKKWVGILRKADAHLGDGDTEEGGEGETVRVELELGDELEPDDEEALLEREDEED
ncbi:hypothetical protein B0H14DRAFT_3510958 [Mycena olivaceomarginata]|nr:hypothetical protein B0H14DRAFT_3510958 [Mycena olivaceomarginata]